MNTPSGSIFQGLDGIKVNSTLERAEEEEAEEDQRRRNEQLGNLLLNAFDDLGDDESTMDSSHFPSEEHLDDSHVHQHQELQQAPLPLPTLSNQNNGIDHYANEIHHLKMLLESRTNELENLKQLYCVDNKKIDELQKRLTLTQAELDRALSTKNNTYELLVESKEKCSNLENTIAKLKNEKKSLETENHTLVGKLETTQTMLSDVQRKYDMVERDLNKHNEKNAEVKRKHMEDRHRAELEILRQQMEQVADKLDKKTSELENMCARYHALQNTHEIMLVDKAGKINELNHALSEAQEKCEELLNKPDYFQENVRLQKLVASLQGQIESMERTIATLNERLEQTTAELDVMDSVLQQHNIEDTPRRLSQTQGHVVGSTPLNTVDRMGNLKGELYRALANVKNKRDEIRKLQQNLEDKNNEISQLRDEENSSLVQITTLKEANIRLENRLKILEEEYKAQARNNEALDSTTQELNSTKIRTLRDQIDGLQEEKTKFLAEIESLRKELEESLTERKKLNVQVENLKVDVDETKQEYEQMKRNFDELKDEHEKLKKHQTQDDTTSLELERNKFLLKEAQTEIDRLKNLYVEICNAKDSLTYENEKLRNIDSVKELQVQREKVSTLQRALQLAEIKCSELMKALENEKLYHERDMHELREKFEKQRLVHDLKASKDNSNNCTKCIDLMAEITKFEIQSLKLNNVTTMQKKEIDDLNEELRTAKSLITELSDKLKVCEHQEQLIKELKTKAQLFENYIKTQSSPSERSLTSPKHQRQNSSTPSSDKGVGTSPELEKTARLTIEARIREEMAKIFATDIKHLQKRLEQMEEQNHCLQNEYKHVTTELQQRQNEVELLKHAILAEREKMIEILNEKDTNSQTILQKHKEIFLRCQDELNEKNRRIAELSKELEERQTQIEAERKSMKTVMTQWETQRKHVDEIENEWREKLKNLEKTHAISMASWQSKYNSAKRTAANYKRYAEDKEAHMLKEYERLKSEYDASLAKIEVHMKEILERKNRELKDARAAAEKQGIYFGDNNKENQPSN